MDEILTFTNAQLSKKGYRSGVMRLVNRDAVAQDVKRLEGNINQAFNIFQVSGVKRPLHCSDSIDIPQIQSSIYIRSSQTEMARQIEGLHARGMVRQFTPISYSHSLTVEAGFPSSSAFTTTSNSHPPLYTGRTLLYP